MRSKKSVAGETIQEIWYHWEQRPKWGSGKGRSGLNMLMDNCRLHIESMYSISYWPGGDIRSTCTSMVP